MIDWQPIETAPKDGTSVLVCYEFATVPIAHIAHYDNDEHDQWENQGFESKDQVIGWWTYLENSVSQHRLEGFNTPTHWAPLNLPKGFYDYKDKE
jgi:hypothetical protein